MRNQITTSEEERNLEKWPMTSSVVVMTSSTLITQFYTRHQQPVTITAQHALLGGTKGVDWKQAKMIEGSSATTKAGSWKGTGRRIIGQEKKITSLGSFYLPLADLM